MRERIQLTLQHLFLHDCPCVKKPVKRFYPIHLPSRLSDVWHNVYHVATKVSVEKTDCVNITPTTASLMIFTFSEENVFPQFPQIVVVVLGGYLGIVRWLLQILGGYFLYRVY